MILRVGLLTLPLTTSYGGILQAAALYAYLGTIGCEVVLLDRVAPKSWRDRLRQAWLSLLPALLRLGGRRTTAEIANAHPELEHAARIRTHRRFIERHIPRRSRPLYSGAELKRATRAHHLDAVVVGSDQVWRFEYQPPNAERDFFLAFAQESHVRTVSYAASFGVDRWQYPEATGMASRLLSGFDAVSVREDTGVAIVRTILGRADAVQAVDPALLVAPDFYERIAAPAAAGPGGPFVLEYVLDGEHMGRTLGEAIAAQLGGGRAVRSIVLDEGRSPVTVGRWVRAFMDADFVVTDSFHGVVLAIRFRKPFLAVLNAERGATRIVSLLATLGIEGRTVDSASADVAAAVAKPIDFGCVETKLAALRQESASFLRTALGKPPAAAVTHAAERRA